MHSVSPLLIFRLKFFKISLSLPGYLNETFLNSITASAPKVGIESPQRARVSGSSMYPTLVNKDYLVLESNFLYKNVKQGDIVVLYTPPFSLNDELIVKRVIATGGQTVDIDFDTGIVYVDGAALDESYTFEPTYESYSEFGKGLTYPVTVPEGSIFAMGDNRNHSMDSRYSDVGCVEERCILGKVLLVIFPGSQTDEYGTVTGNRKLGRIGTVS